MFHLAGNEQLWSTNNSSYHATEIKHVVPLPCYLPDSLLSSLAFKMPSSTPRSLVSFPSRIIDGEQAQSETVCF